MVYISLLKNPILKSSTLILHQIHNPPHNLYNELQIFYLILFTIPKTRMCNTLLELLKIELLIAGF